MGRWLRISEDIKMAVGDATDGESRGWALESARLLNADAHFLLASVTIGTTTAGTSEYDLAASMVDLAQVRVGTADYQRVGYRDIWELQAGRASVTGSGGVFAPAYSATGAIRVEFYPTPTQSGLTIEGLQVLDVPTPTVWETDDPPFPSDFDRAVVHGGASIGLALRDDRFDAAQWHEERRDQAVGRMKRRKHSRVGSGATRIRVRGKDF